MRARDAFGVFVRGTGMIVVLMGLNHLVGAISVTLMQSSAQNGFLSGQGMNTLMSAQASTATFLGAITLAFGALIMFGAEIVVAACYGPVEQG